MVPVGVANGGSMNTDEQAIRNLITQWHRATAAGDVDTVLRLMAEDVIFPLPGKPPMKGRATFEQGLRRVLTSHRFERGTPGSRSLDLAYCWSLLKVRMTPLSGGDPAVRSGSALSIFREQPNGSWLLVRDANLLPSAS